MAPAGDEFHGIMDDVYFGNNFNDVNNGTDG
jgi:hypothetical protein